MKYSFTFSTLSDYLNAKASGGVIYNVLRANNPASISQTAISHITGTGQTFIDAVNIIVSREEGGEIGDTLLYKTSDGKYYWLKGFLPTATAIKEPSVIPYNYGNPSAHGWVTRSGSGTSSSPYVYTPSSHTAAVSGTTYYQAYFGSSSYWLSLLTDNGYNVIGFVGHREGNKCLIFSERDKQQGYKFSTATTVSSNYGCPYPVRHNGVGVEKPTWQICCSLELSEYVRGYGTTSNCATREFPVNRAAWDNMVANIKSNSPTSGRITAGVFVADGGWGTGSPVSEGGYIVTQGSNGVGIGNLRYALPETYTNSVSVDEINPADYNYDYDTWFRTKLLVKIPTNKGAMSEESGLETTKKLISEPDGASLYPAANFCNNFKPMTSPPFKFSAGKWWLPSAKEMWYLMKNYVTLFWKGIEITQTTYWTSTIENNGNGSTPTQAQAMSFSAAVIRHDPFSNNFYALPVTTFNI